MLSAAAGGSGLPHDSSPQLPGAAPLLPPPEDGRPRKPQPWLGPAQPAAQHSGEWRLLPGPGPPPGTGWPGSFVPRAGGALRPFRAPRSGPSDPVAAVPAVRSVFVSTGARGSAGLGWKPGRQCREGGGGGGRGGGAGRGGSRVSWPPRGSPAPPARGRGARSALPRALSAFPLPPSSGLKLQFALQLAEKVVVGVVVVVGAVWGDRGSGEQGWVLGTALEEGETAEGGAPPLQPQIPRFPGALGVEGRGPSDPEGVWGGGGMWGGRGQRGWAACPVTWRTKSAHFCINK